VEEESSSAHRRARGGPVEDVIRLFNENGVRYLLLGGQAMRLYGMPRFTMDWDILIPPHDGSNIKQINELLGNELDVPLLELGHDGQNVVQTYQTRWGVLQFHLLVPGLPSFDEAERRSVTLESESGDSVRCLSERDLLASKRAANRPEDQQDIEFLELKLRHESDR
jgi:hypothetical protein